MTHIHNPILRGFNPDPSIIRVGDDFYIATSTFEWFPGVQIHHSRDLIHWQLIGHPLTRVSQLDMLGCPDSCGVWAPCLSYDNGTFYLIYTNVRSFQGVWKDTPNYMVTSSSIHGPWSEPILLNASGFDPSLFHDDDGRKWLLNMLMDHRGGKFFGGIVAQEWDQESHRLKGPVHYLFEGTALGCTEGPHLYKRDGYYYMLTAEGGTEYAHAVTVARSKAITGPYAVHPDNPMVTCLPDPEHPIQKSGHADIVETASGDWYIAFLVSRPLTTRGRCTLGRETALEQMEWCEDGWPRLLNGRQIPRQQVTAPQLAPHPFDPESQRDDFEGSTLSPHWASLRVPADNTWASLSARPGYLRLTGRESLSSLFRQSLLARRVQAHRIHASCVLDFQPDHFQQMAGLVCYYNSYHFHYLCVTANDDGKRVLTITSCDKYQMDEPLKEEMLLPEIGEIFLGVEVNHASLQFRYALKEGSWQEVGPKLDASILSDDYVCDAQNRYRPAFTGTFVGICCQDLSGQQKTADFDWFDYQEV